MTSDMDMAKSIKLLILNMQKMPNSQRDVLKRSKVG